MKILYIGSGGVHSSSRHRADALGRLGHVVTLIDPYLSIPRGRYSAIFHFHTGYRFIADAVLRYISAQIDKTIYDVVWVDSGELISLECVNLLKARAAKIINYNLDDPTGKRDGQRWATFLGSIRAYDLCVVVRNESEVEYARYGAKCILKVWRSADEVEHAPRIITPKIYEKWRSEVAFVGTWMPERGPFMLELVKSGVPLSIWGNRWHKAKEWPHLKSYWCGSGIFGDDYAYAIQCSKVNLGLLSGGNRDLHTQRSAEIPSLGGLLCAERTVEHLKLYEDGRDAVFWDDSVECAQVIKRLLIDPRERNAIAVAGRDRFIGNGIRNEVVVANILSSL